MAWGEDRAQSGRAPAPPSLQGWSLTEHSGHRNLSASQNHPQHPPESPEHPGDTLSTHPTPNSLHPNQPEREGCSLRELVFSRSILCQRPQQSKPTPFSAELCPPLQAEPFIDWISPHLLISSRVPGRERSLSPGAVDVWQLPGKSQTRLGAFPGRRRCQALPPLLNSLYSPGSAGVWFAAFNEPRNCCGRARADKDTA